MASSIRLAMIATVMFCMLADAEWKPPLKARSARGLCRCFPTDDCWPSPDTWDSFNVSIGGNLIANSPLAASCHVTSPTGYDAGQCTLIQQTWFFPETHLTSPSSPMAPLFMNNSCSPFSGPEAPCAIGNEPWFTVNATTGEHFQKTIQFATEANIRLVIRNTGHDYNGKSTGADGLALWTNHIKTREVLDYDSELYTGKAFKFGAGLLTIEAYEFAESHGLLVVGANLPTVGIVGGYTQGGGHGPLASKFGLGADQVLEWEVVLASGEIVTATPFSQEHAGLYWALCGGGGGTFGAVLSVTVKGHQPMTLSTANLAFAAASNTTTAMDTFYDGVDAFHGSLLSLSDAGAVAIWYVTQGQFSSPTIFGSGLDRKELDMLMSSALGKLDHLGIKYVYTSQQHASFVEGFLAQPPVNVSNLNIGGRLIPRGLVENNTLLGASVRKIASSPYGAVFSGVSFNVSMHHADSVAANPYWREAAFSAVIGIPFDYTNWDANLRLKNALTNEILPELERATPNGAVYLNEADFQQPDWQSAFYGSSWDRLSSVKAKYDPQGIFYALGAVGSERWSQQSDGRLCAVP